MLFILILLGTMHNGFGKPGDIISKYTLSFESVFTATCHGKTTLHISADNNFRATVNDGK